MASLSQQLNRPQLVRGADGQLQEQKSTQQLASQLGMATQPTTPIGGAMIGANPDQQKMLGGPANLSASLNKQQDQVAPQNNLQTAIRQQQARTATTGAEQQKMQKSKDMEALGGLGDRVTNFIDTQKQNMQAATAQSKVATGQFGNTDLNSIKDKLLQLRTNPTDMNLMLDVQKSLGMDTSRQLSPAEINTLYEQNNDAIARTGAESVQDSLTVQDLLQDNQFGYDAPTLAQLLGVSEQELQGMSVSQLQDRVGQIHDEEFNKSQQNLQQANSNVLGQAERGMARQEGRELSATGLRSTEADVANLEQQIAQADQVSFGGKDYKVDDLLQDDTISGIIKNYLESAPGSLERQQMERTEPGLVDFIKKNEAVLEDAAKQLETGATQFSGIQDATRRLQTEAFGGIKMDDSVMQAIIPGWGELRAENVNPAQVPVLSYLQNRSPQQKQAFANEINQAIQLSPTVGKELARLDAGDIQRLGIDNNSAKWKTYKRTAAERKDIESLDPTDSTHLLQHFAPNIEDVNQLNRDIKLSTTQAGLGFGDPNYTTAGIPLKNDNRDVDTDKLKEALLNKISVPTLTRALSGDLTSSAAINYRSPPNYSPTSPQGKTLRLFSNYGTQNKTPSLEEIKQVLTNQDRGDEANYVTIEDLDKAGTLKKWGITPQDYLKFAMELPSIQIQSQEEMNRNIQESLRGTRPQGYTGP